MTKPYFGRLLTAMVTPFNEDGSINYAAGADFAEWLLANGSDGLVVEGSTGEAATMNMDEKVKFMETIVKRVNGRAKIVAGAGTNCTASTIELVQKMEACGVDGLLVVGPYYNKPTQEGYYQHFAAVAKATKLPIIVYNSRNRRQRQTRSTGINAGNLGNCSLDRNRIAFYEHSLSLRNHSLVDISSILNTAFAVCSHQLLQNLAVDITRYNCTHAFYSREGKFADYDADTHYMSFTCGGCCGGALTVKLENLCKRLRRFQETDQEIIIHLSTCMVSDNSHKPPCPHLEYIMTLLEKKGFTVECVYDRPGTM